MAAEYPDMVAFEAAAALADGVHSVEAGGFRLDLLLRGVPGAPLVVFFYGAMDRAKEPSLPIFRGTQITEGLAASFLTISDPSLGLDGELGLAWFAGARGWDVQGAIPRAIRKVAAAVAASRVMFLGGSGGGFAALHYALHVPESLAVVWNPQTDIRRYWKRHVGHYGRVCFGYEAVEDFVAAMPGLIRCDLRDWYRERYAGQAVLYLQNRGDAHVRKQAAPFFRQRAAVAWDEAQNRRVWEHMWLCLREWGEGHAVPPRAVVRGLAERLLACPEDWGALVRSGGMGALVEDAFGL